MELNFRISSSLLVLRTGKTFLGVEVEVERVVTLTSLSSNGLLFSKRVDNELMEKLGNLKGCLMILPEEAGEIPVIEKLKSGNSVVLSKHPRLDFARFLGVIEQEIKKDSYCLTYSAIGGATIGERTSIGNNTLIEPGSFIDHDVTIGDNCVIRSGAVIRSRVKIGDNVTIRENTVVGGPGFGVERDEDGNNYRIPHLGGVIIKSNVEIGALNTVVSGTIEPTTIEEYVKTDDHIHIAHNCHIGKNTSITACVEISGSVYIGEDCMIGPNSSVMNGILIGKNTVVGLGSVVTKSVAENSVVAGNPADLIENIKIQRRAMKKVIGDYIKASDHK